MRKFLLVALTAVLVAGVAQTASAAPYTWAQSVVNRQLNGAAVPNDRNCSAAALLAPGAPAPAGCQPFLSLGLDTAGDPDLLGGFVTLDFGTLFDHAAIIFETTFNCRPVAGNGCAGYLEAADVFVSASNIPFSAATWTPVGTVPNGLANDGEALLFAGGPFRYLTVIDSSRRVYGAGAASGDGFDLNAVGVTAVPEPASLLLLGMGLVGLAGGIRRGTRK